MLLEILEPVDVLLLELLSSSWGIRRIWLALDGLIHKLVKRLFKALEPVLSNEEELFKYQHLKRDIK